MHLTGQSVALGLVLVPLTVGVQRAALAVGQLAAHVLVPHRTLSEVLHALQQTKKSKEVRVCVRCTTCVIPCKLRRVHPLSR